MCFTAAEEKQTREKTTIETKVGEPGFSIVGGFGFPFAGEWGMV